MTGRSQKVSSSLPMSQQHALVSKLTPTAVALRSAPRTRARTQPGSGGRDVRRALLVAPSSSAPRVSFVEVRPKWLANQPPPARARRLSDAAVPTAATSR